MIAFSRTFERESSSNRKKQKESITLSEDEPIVWGIAVYLIPIVASSLAHSMLREVDHRATSTCAGFDDDSTVLVEQIRIGNQKVERIQSAELETIKKHFYRGVVRYKHHVPHCGQCRGYNQEHGYRLRDAGIGCQAGR